jgi:hypothetical protein
MLAMDSGDLQEPLKWLRFVCDGVLFESVLDIAFETRCRGTFFEQFLTDRWNHTRDADHIVITSMCAVQFRKIWYFMQTGVQWPFHKNIADLFEYKGAVDYCCLNMPDMLAQRMIATPSYLYIQLGAPSSNLPDVVCMPLDTQICVNAGIEDGWHTMPAQGAGSLGPQVGCQMSFFTTPGGVVCLDSDEGIISLSEHGVRREILRHKILYRKQILNVVYTPGPEALDMWIELGTARAKKRSLWLKYRCLSQDRRSRPQVQFVRGASTHLKDGSFVFLEHFPKFVLHCASDTVGIISFQLWAPKEADDIVIALMQGKGKIPSCPALMRGKGKISCGVKGRGGKDGTRPLWMRHSKHAGSCLDGRSPKDVWVVQRDGHCVFVVHTFDGRVALGQLRGPHQGIIPSAQFGLEPLPLWGSPKFGGYHRRRMVPRAGSIEGVLPLGEQIYIFHTTTPSEPLKLWKVDLPPVGREQTFFLFCEHASNPKGKGKHALAPFHRTPVGSWMSWWGEGQTSGSDIFPRRRPQVPRGFLKLGSFPQQALVAIDGSCKDVEVIRFRRCLSTSKWFSVAHTVATPPPVPNSQQSEAPFEFALLPHTYSIV